MIAKSLALAFILLLITSVSGCLCFGDRGYGDTWRTYDHTGSKSVTINIFKMDRDNLTVLESGSNEIQVKEDVFYEVRKWVENDTSGQFKIEDYVRFYGDEDNLAINISLKPRSEEDLVTYRAYANVFVYLPPGTNYTINYVKDNEVKGRES